MPLPNPETIQLLRTNQREDSASMSIIHNKNAKAIEDWLKQIVEYVASIEDGGTGGTIDQTEFNQLLEGAKNVVLLPVTLTIGQYIDFNGYRITKQGPVAGQPLSMEFRITDTNTSRQTDFRQSVLIVKSFAGQTIYTKVISSINTLSIIFDNASDVEQSTVNASTDPNRKRIILF